MEKISADIAAAEEAARKRLAEREKDAGERGVRDTPTCVLAEEEKHICATHGNKSHQNSLSQGSAKEGEDAQSNTTDTAGERYRASLCGLLFGHLTHVFFCILFLDLGKPKASEELETQGASEEAVPEDKEIVPEGAMEEGTSDSNTGSETTSAQTEDVPANEPSEALGKARAAH